MLMATMLAGATLMNGALLVIDATAPCPQPQTREHFKALEVIGVRNLIIVQNKVEVPSREKVIENLKQIRELIEGTWAEEAPIIPVSALHKANMDILIQTIEEHIPTPALDQAKPLLMPIARSFDVNKPGTPPEELVGGVLGGSILQGKVSIGDEIEVRPGLRVERAGKVYYEPIFTKVVGLKSGGSSLKEAFPGGLIAIATLLDPSLTKADNLVGNVVGKAEALPPVLNEVNVETHLLERVVGTHEMVEVEKLKPKENIMIISGTAVTLGIIRSVKEDVFEATLRRPICAQPGSRVALSRQVFGKWRLIGHGVLKE